MSRRKRLQVHVVLTVVGVAGFRTHLSRCRKSWKRARWRSTHLLANSVRASIGKVVRFGKKGGGKNLPVFRLPYVVAVGFEEPKSACK